MNRILIGLILLSNGLFAQNDSAFIASDSIPIDSIQPIVYTFTEPAFTLSSDFYKTRYEEEDLMTKIIDNY